MHRGCKPAAVSAASRPGSWRRDSAKMLETRPERATHRLGQDLGPTGDFRGRAPGSSAPPMSGSTVVRPRCLGPRKPLRRRSVGRAGASSGVGECTKTSVRALKPEDMCHCARPSTMTGPVIRPHGPARSPSQTAATAGPGHRLGQDGGYAAC